MIQTLGAQSQVFQANNTNGCTPLGVVLTVTSPAASSITSYFWQITTPTGSVLTSSSAQYIGIFSIPGNYDVSLTINGSQTQTVLDYISVHELPAANFTVNDPEGCFPLCVDFTDISISSDGDIVEWSWDFGDGGSSILQNPSYCYNQVGTFTPVFSVENEHGCFADFAVPGMIEVVNNFPTASFQLSSQLDCNLPVDISITNSSTGTSALASVWDFGDGGSTSSSGTLDVNHNFTSIGTFDVCLTVTDMIGCQDEACQPVTIFGAANATYTVSAIEGCEGEIFTFTNTTTPAPPTIEWDFNNDGIVDSNNPTASYSYANAGTFQPTLNVHYSDGCVDLDANSYLITIIDGIDVSFIGDTLQSCAFPFTVQFDNLSTGQAPINYEWFVNDVSVGSTTDLSYTFNEYGSFDIKLVATNAAGCSNELVLTDYVLVQAPVVDFDNGVSVCTDQNVPIFNVQVISVDPVEFYFWDFNSDGNTDAEGIAPMFMFTSPGIYNITLTIETIHGCTASYTNTQSINVLTQVDANFTASADTTCAGQSVEFCVTQQPGNTFSWNFFDGSGWVIMALDESCISHDYADTGWFDLSLTVFNGACNVLQTFENFIYVEPPVALFEYQVICGDLSAQFADISIGADSIAWDFGDGSPSLSNDPNPTHSFPASGTYTVTLAAFANGSDCPDYQTADITVSDPDPTMFFSPNNGCPPLDVDLHSQVFNPSWDVIFSTGDHITVNWIEASSYWSIHHSSPNGNQTLAFTNPDYFYWPSVTITEGGFVDVSVTTTDVNGCTANFFYDDVIEVSANPDFASFSTIDVDVCNSVNLGFVPDLENLTSWQWVFSDGSISTNENPFHTFNPPYNYDQPLTATLTATDSLGCVSSVTQNINVTLPPLVDFIVATDPSCIGDVVQFINFSVGPDGTTYNWDFGDPTSAENTSELSAPTHIFSTNGTYEVCLHADNQAGCIRTYCNSEAVHIVNPEVAFDYTSNINNCLYGVQFQNTTPGNVVSSEWDFGDNQSGFGMMAFHTYPIGVYDVKLTVVNNFGCTDSLTVPDIFNYANQIGPYTQLLDSASCAPFEVSFSSFNINDTYFTYFWDFNDGNGDPSNNTATSHTYLEPGTYCPSIIMTDPNGCPVLISCSQPITVDEFVLDYSIPEYICFGDTLHATIGNATNYVWADESELTLGASNNEAMLHPNDDFTYILTGYYADCVHTDTIFLEVKDLPIVTLDLPASVCFNDTIIPLNTGMPNIPIGTYFVNDVESNSFDPSWPISVNYEVRYEYTDTFQCVNSVSDFVYIHPLPVTTFNDFVDVCEDADSIDIRTATPAGGVYVFLTDSIDYFQPSNGYGSYDFEYIFTDVNGCVDADSANLVVHPLPTPSISYSDACLDNGLVIANATTIPEGSISSTLWNFGSAGNSASYNPGIVYFNSIGTQNFAMTATSDYGCMASIDTSVVMHAVPEIQFTPEETCQHTPSMFYDQSSIAGDSLIQWIWNIEGSVFSGSDSLNHTFHNWGEIPVQLVVISSFGCDDTLITDVTVHPAPVSAISYTHTCHGDETLFASNTSIPAGSIISEEWTFGDGQANEYGNTADNLYSDTGFYPITHTSISNLGCVITLQDTIQVYPLPSVDFVLDPVSLCAGAPFQLIDLSSVELPSDVVEWSWWFDSEPISQEQNPILTWNEPGTYDITLTATTNNACSADSTLQNGITIYPNPTAGFTTSEEAMFSNPVITISNQASEDVTDWYYDFGDSNGDVFESGEHFFEEFGTFLIQQTVFNTFGCRDTASRFIVIHPDMLVFVPNAFTPDANGHNELFLPVISGFDLTLFEMKIFDRWGIEVYSSTEPEKGWDGTFNGGPAENGAYAWTMDIRSSTDVTIQRRTGSVMLLR
jgi:gliding motility-associated-like protein